MEALKCALSLAALARIWSNEGVTEDNRSYSDLMGELNSIRCIMYWLLRNDWIIGDRERLKPGIT